MRKPKSRVGGLRLRFLAKLGFGDDQGDFLRSVEDDFSYVNGSDEKCSVLSLLLRNVAKLLGGQLLGCRNFGGGFGFRCLDDLHL